SGAKNHSIVLSDANVDNATTEIMNAAFGSAGERCMACAVVAVEDEIADEFIEQLVEKANNIKIGKGLDEGIFLGPVIRSEHKDRTLQYIETGEKEGEASSRDGRKDESAQKDDYFVGQ